jgi:type III restriction enzyme
MSSENPILNSPYLEPLYHYSTDIEGNLDYRDIRPGRRLFKPDWALMPSRKKGQKDFFDGNEDIAGYHHHMVNLCRREVKQWRDSGYGNTTRITQELLTYWFNNPERVVTQKLFFAQQEAIETAIWLNEVAEKSNAGQHILNLLREAQRSVSENACDQLPRIAFKMATGTGKTVVMACLICYHYFNRQEYKQDTRFADYFLVIVPSITIKSRLNVLFVDTNTKNRWDIQDYYRIRGLVPANKEHRLENLNARLIVINYHKFEPRALEGNKCSPFDGKVDLKGNKLNTNNKEDFHQVLKRTLGKFKFNSRILILNDEAHHCYLPKSQTRTTDHEEADENTRAAVWFSGIREIAKKFKLQAVYDLSATPYYLNGSGYTPYSLFPWVVSDFGLIEAIESGLVKIPFLPESDNSQELTMPVLRNLYEHVKQELPKKGQRMQRRDAALEGKKLTELPPRLPSLVKIALDQFYNHYVDYYNGIRRQQQERVNIFSLPPVFIIVCNNTGVSKEVYKYIAGYEYEDAEGNTIVVKGAKDLFSNYDPQTKKPLRRPPTLLIDSDALENGEQINDEFKKIFASEIEEFKKDYVRMHGQGSADKISDAEILREVVNTVGQPGKLGSHIRCVVSVSMLTEGWDANTVTHIMGLRAFGSQLLCEQVIGRALRRTNYYLQGYDKDGHPTDDKSKVVIEKFPPEYAHIIGFPFKMFRGGKTELPPPPVQLTSVCALPERQSRMEIIFPNVVGYRVEYLDGAIEYDFSKLENYELSYTVTRTKMGTPISGEEQLMEVKEVLEKREQEIIFYWTKELLKQKFSDEEGQNPHFHKFNKLKKIVEAWYHERLITPHGDAKYKKLVFYEDSRKVVEHIYRGINPHLNTSEYIRPVLNYYNKFGSSKYVMGKTSKEVFLTEKSHVNYVVMDSYWEGVCAKALEEIPLVECYVKNQFLGFSIPYSKDGKERQYFVDFIAKVRGKDGSIKNLMIEVSGMSNDKAEKRWFVENRWLPGVNALREKYQYPEWHFIEIVNDVRNIKNQLMEKIQCL